MRFPSGNWSLQPVAIGAAAEVTKPSKPSRPRAAFGRLGEQAGRNASERHASPETRRCGSRPGCYTGKAAVSGDQRGPPLTTRHAPGVPPGYGRRHARTRRSDATREASAVGARDSQPTTREGQVGPFEVAERPVRARKPGNAGGAKGPQFKVNVPRGTTARRLAMSLPPPLTGKALSNPFFFL